jgi:hypothetical protein
MPSSFSSGASPRFSAPITLVGDARGMPVHAHHGTERLEPERVGQAAQQLIASAVVDDRFADYRPKAGHSVGEPLGDLSTVQREVCAPRSLSHLEHPFATAEAMPSRGNYYSMPSAFRLVDVPQSCRVGRVDAGEIAPSFTWPE